MDWADYLNEELNREDQRHAFRWGIVITLIAGIAWITTRVSQSGPPPLQLTVGSVGMGSIIYLGWGDRLGQGISTSVHPRPQWDPIGNQQSVLLVRYAGTVGPPRSLLIIIILDLITMAVIPFSLYVTHQTSAIVPGTVLTIIILYYMWILGTSLPVYLISSEAFSSVLTFTVLDNHNLSTTIPREPPENRIYAELLVYTHSWWPMRGFVSLFRDGEQNGEKDSENTGKAGYFERASSKVGALKEWLPDLRTIVQVSSLIILVGSVTGAYALHRLSDFPRLFVVGGIILATIGVLQVINQLIRLYIDRSRQYLSELHYAVRNNELDDDEVALLYTLIQVLRGGFLWVDIGLWRLWRKLEIDGLADAPSLWGTDLDVGIEPPSEELLEQ